MARLLLGDGAAAACHAALLPQRAADGGPEPPAWSTLRAHTEALQHRAAAVSSESACPRVQQLLTALAAEAEGEGDEEADRGPAELLTQLAGLLTQGSSSSSSGGGGGGGAEEAAAAAAMDASPQGHRILLFFLADPDPATQRAAEAALQAVAQAAAGSPAAVLWPAQVWARLTAVATEPQQGSAAAAAMELLRWAAERDAWVRQQVLTHPLVAPAAEGAEPVSLAPLPRIAAALRDSERQLPPAAAEAAARLFRAYAADPAAAEALGTLGCSPLLALLRAAAAADSEAVEAASAGADVPADAGASGPGSAEAAALQQLRLKRLQVYDAPRVCLRRSLLAAAAELAGASRELVRAEAVQAAGSRSGGGSKRSAQAGAFLAGQADRRLSGCAAPHTCAMPAEHPPISLDCPLRPCLPVRQPQRYWPWPGACTSSSRSAPRRRWALTARRGRTPSAGKPGQLGGGPEGCGCCWSVLELREAGVCLLGSLQDTPPQPTTRTLFPNPLTTIPTPLKLEPQVRCRLQGQPRRRLFAVAGPAGRPRRASTRGRQ